MKDTLSIPLLADLHLEKHCGFLWQSKYGWDENGRTFRSLLTYGQVGPDYPRETGKGWAVAMLKGFKHIQFQPRNHRENPCRFHRILNTYSSIVRDWMQTWTTLTHLFYADYRDKGNNRKKAHNKARPLLYPRVHILPQIPGKDRYTTTVPCFKRSVRFEIRDSRLCMPEKSDNLVSWCTMR